MKIVKIYHDKTEFKHRSYLSNSRIFIRRSQFPADEALVLFIFAIITIKFADSLQNTCKPVINATKQDKAVQMIQTRRKMSYIYFITGDSKRFTVDFLTGMK